MGSSPGREAQMQPRADVTAVVPRRVGTKRVVPGNEKIRARGQPISRGAVGRAYNRHETAKRRKSSGIKNRIIHHEVCWYNGVLCGTCEATSKDGLVLQ